MLAPVVIRTGHALKYVNLVERSLAAMAPRPSQDDVGFAGAMAASTERIMNAASARTSTSLRDLAYHLRPYIETEHTKFIKQLTHRCRAMSQARNSRRVDAIVTDIMAATVEPSEAGQGGSAPHHDDDDESLSQDALGRADAQPAPRAHQRDRRLEGGVMAAQVLVRLPALRDDRILRRRAAPAREHPGRTDAAGPCGDGHGGTAPHSDEGRLRSLEHQVGMLAASLFEEAGARRGLADLQHAGLEERLEVVCARLDRLDDHQSRAPIGELMERTPPFEDKAREFESSVNPSFDELCDQFEHSDDKDRGVFEEQASNEWWTMVAELGQQVDTMDRGMGKFSDIHIERAKQSERKVQLLVEGSDARLCLPRPASRSVCGDECGGAEQRR